MNQVFDIVRRETLEAYADVHPQAQSDAMKRRKLDWRASAPISRDEAIQIMDETCPSYNEFIPKLLKKLPIDSQITLARESSVCVYVTSTGNASKKTMKADEWTRKNVLTRIWWD